MSDAAPATNPDEASRVPHAVDRIAKWVDPGNIDLTGTFSLLVRPPEGSTGTKVF